MTTASHPAEHHPVEQVLDAADRQFIAGDLPAGEQHDVPLRQTERVAAIGDPRELVAALAIVALGGAPKEQPPRNLSGPRTAASRPL